MSHREIDQPARRAIADFFANARATWSGRFEEDQFLARLYDLAALPSHDYRFKTAAQDIHQHRTNNYDWSDDWVFYDSRFNLLTGEDTTFLDFLIQVVDPNVQSPEVQTEIVEGLNSVLARCGWRLAPTRNRNGSTEYTATRLNHSASLTEEAALRLAEELNDAYMDRMINRLLVTADSAPEECIGAAKELIETTCRLILSQRAVVPVTGDDLPKLVKATLDSLDLNPADQPSTRAGRATRQLGSALTSVTQAVAELRNELGTGHGHLPGQATGDPDVAHLVSGASAAVSRYLYETHLRSFKSLENT